MRLIKLTRTDGRTLFVAPAAVVAVNESDDCADNTCIWAGDGTFHACVKEDLATVMNALYYKNDGGHSFGNPPIPAPTPTPTEGTSV